MIFVRFLYLTNALQSIVGLLNMNLHLVDAVVDHTQVSPLRQSRHISNVKITLYAPYVPTTCRTHTLQRCKKTIFFSQKIHGFQV